MTSLQMRRWYWQNKQAASPRDLAKLFAAELKTINGVTDVKIAGPGFLNIDVEEKLWTNEIANILSAGLSYGKSEIGDW